MSKHIPVVIFGVTLNFEKCLSACLRDLLVGLRVGTLERGKKRSSIDERGTT